LRTGEMQPTAPEAYCSKMTAVAPGGDCPRWQQFMREITGDDTALQAYLQRLVGCSLVGQVIEQVIVFLYGTGANGKGVFLGALSGVLADYAKVAPIDTFTETKSERHPTDMAMLRGARLATAQETDEGRAWAEARIKALTGGDPITARFMHQDFFTYTPQFTLVIAGNHKPNLRNVDEAMRRRLHMVPFTVTIAPENRDPNLPEKLKEEWPGILQWAIEGCMAWQRDGLAPPSAVTDMTADYFAEQDPLSAWIGECCETSDRGAWTSFADLYQSYGDHTVKAREVVETRKRFSARLESRGFTKTRQGAASVRGFYGVKLIGPEDWGSL
jgi:putative DNA primase/helicase